jgi:ubiquinone/menaquinone biosynthesis C-methylase UbiE
MSMRLLGPDFSDVDASHDPSRQVAYLDAVASLEGARAYKRRSYSLLRVRPGATILDVGCGAGADLRELAALVGRSGRVVGIDSSSTMVAQARERTAGLPVECQVGDAHALAFGDERFDACRADRVLQHLADAPRGLAELIRVTRRDGRVVVFDPDWDSLLVSGSERALTRAIVAFHCDSTRTAGSAGSLSAWSGRLALPR